MHCTRSAQITVVELLRCALKLAVLLGSGDRMLILGGKAHLDSVTAAIAANRAKAAADVAVANGKKPPPTTPLGGERHDTDVDPTSTPPLEAAEGPQAGSSVPSASAPSPPLIQPETAPGAAAAEKTAPTPPSFTPTPTGSFVPPVWWKGQRTGVRGMLSPALAKTASHAAAAAAAAGDVAAASGGFASMAYTRRVEGIALLGELLHILRPLVAAVGMRVQGGAGGWAPLLLSAAMDAASWQLSEYAAQEGGAADTRPCAPSLLDAITGRGAFKHITLRSGAAAAAAGGAAAGDATDTSSSNGAVSKAFDSGLAALALRLVWWASSAAMGASAAAGAGRCLCPEEEEELSRRKRMWALYLLRSPVFQRGTMPAAERVAGAAGYVPVLGWVVQFAVGMLGYYNRVHFYNSGSS